MRMIAIQWVPGLVRLWLVGLLMLALVGVSVIQAQAQDAKVEDADAATNTQAADQNAAPAKPVPWMYRAYKVRVWLMLDSSSCWSPAVVQGLEARILQHLEQVEPSAWRIEMETLPLGARADIRGRDLAIEDLDESLYDQLQEDQVDKLFLVRVNNQFSHLEVLSNEIDAVGWSLGPVYERNVTGLGHLANVAADMICDSFRPIARVENTLTENIIMSVRAYGLMFREVPTVEDSSETPEVDGEEAAGDEGTETDEASTPGPSTVSYTSVPDRSSPCWIDEKQIFEPVIRKANRQKRFELAKVEHPEFTLLVQETKVESPTFESRIVSAKRAEVALGRRTGKMTERYGIVVRTPPGVTTIQLVTMRGPSLSQLQEEPLNGYEIYSRSIFGTDDSTEYMGKTNWEGKIDIYPGPPEEPVRLLYVKSGERLLARLPVMPGYKPVMKETLPDDETRINAEGVVSGLRARVLDLVARREVLLERMTQAMLKGPSELETTLTYFDMYDELMDLADWLDMLTSTQRRLVSTDKRQQSKIDAMFEELQTFAKEEIRPIDDSEINQMVLAAKKGEWDKVRELIIARQARKQKEKEAEEKAAAEAAGGE